MSELVQLKLNIGASVGESTPKRKSEHPLEEVGVSELIKRIHSETRLAACCTSGAVEPGILSDNVHLRFTAL